MTAAERPIGILGGTFDPVHNGHLRVALEAYEQLDLDHVRLTPLNQPGHRPGPCAPAALRLAMLRLIERPPLVVDDCEIARGGVSYTVDTLATLRRRWPRRALCLIVGRDAFESLPAWHRAERLLELAHVVVAARPGAITAAAPGLDELIGSAQSLRVADLHTQPAGRVYFLDIPLLPIASSDLRARRVAGRDIRYLLPESVHDFVLARGLYQE